MVDKLQGKSFALAISAPRGSGKSHLTRGILRVLVDEYDKIVIISPSLDLNDDFKQFRLNYKFTFIADPINQTVIDKQFVDSSNRKKYVLHENARVGYDRHRVPRKLVVLDDIIDSGVIAFKGSVDKIAERGRHANISVIINSQRLTAISRSIRINSDMFIFFSPFERVEMFKFFETFIEKAYHKVLKLQLEEIFDREHTFIVLDNSERKWVDKLKWSIAEDFIKGILHPLQLHEDEKYVDVVISKVI